MSSIQVKRVPDSPLWAVYATYFSKALVSESKAVPGMRFERELAGMRNVWVGYVDAVSAVVARLAHAGIRVSFADDLPKPDSWRTGRTPFLFSTAKLRDYQVEGVRFLIAKSEEGCLLADGMRLGKSLQATIAARAFKQKTLILCPSHVVGVWARPPEAPEGPGEIAKWWPDAWKSQGGTRGVCALHTVKPYAAQELVRKLERKSASAPAQAETDARAEIAVRTAALDDVNVVVCHYDIIYAWVDILKAWGFRTLVIDEGHILGGFQSRRSNAIKELRAFTKRCIVLTGTPITNRPKNAHNVFEIISPGRFGYFFAGERQGVYARVFCDAHQETVGEGEHKKTVWNYKGRSNLDAPDGKLVLTHAETLQARVAHLMLRRLKRDVDPQLPNKVRTVIDVTVPAKSVIAVSIPMLKGGRGELRAALDAAADAKLKHVVAVVEGHVLEQETVICMCYRRLFAERVAMDVKKKVKDAARVEFVHGGMTQRERDRRIHALRKHDGVGVLCCTIDTTSTGIDLSFAGVMTFGELTWAPWELAQAEERLYAFGVDKKALIEYIIARGTGDELLLRAVIKKLDTFERVIGATGDGMSEDLSKKRGDPMKALYAALAEMQKPQGGSDAL